LKDVAVRELVDTTVEGMGEGEGEGGEAANVANYDEDRQLHSFEIDATQVGTPAA
jgi:hypothetical protein